MEVEVITRQVKPETVEKLRSDLSTVEQTLSDKEEAIHLLQADIVAIKDRLDVIEIAKTGE